MARTKQEILDAFLADPQYAVLTSTVNGEAVTLSDAERLALINEWADNQLALEVETEAEATRKAIRDQVRTARAMLIAIRDDANMTNAEAVQNIRDLARIQLGVITVLIDRALVERE